MRRVSRVHARVVHLLFYGACVVSLGASDSERARYNARSESSVNESETEYIGLKASRRSVTYTHLTACTHSSSCERTNNARTSSAREVGHERTAIALSAFAPWRQARNRARCVHLHARTPPPRLCAYAGCGACTHLSACTHPTLRTRREPTNVMAGGGVASGARRTC